MNDSSLPPEPALSEAEGPSDPPPPPAEATAAADALLARPRGRWWGLLKRNLTPRLAATFVLWRVEARLLLPGGLALVAAFGRWPAAFIAGGVGALLAGLFMWLLAEERAIGEVRAWGEQSRFVRGYLLPIAERRDRTGTLLRLASVPVLVLYFGPFWRSLTLLLFRVRGFKAYAFTMLSGIPHALLWVGIVAGTLWEDLIWPFLKSHF
ncbi:MAG: hypothetical protein Q8P22_13925 [Chloroflexota bacterium]|nr:hypothetical protein [Chloroflexota bacterium]